MQNASAPLDLHRTTTGSGLPIICSHGVGSSAEIWDGIAGVLSAYYEVTAWDQPGHGSSPQLSDPSGYGPRLAYNALEQVVGDRRVVLVGHSLGGYLSARFAIDHPEQVAALVLIATGPGFRAAEAREKWNADITRQAEKQGRPETLVGLHEDSHVMDHLAEISCPTMILVGADDVAFVGATDYIERKIPGIERFTVAEAGHMAPATHAPEIAGIVADFLAPKAGKLAVS